MVDQDSDAVPRREWVTCFLACVFDLDAGQTVESCYPEGVLTLGESKGIAYGAFPVRTGRVGSGSQLEPSFGLALNSQLVLQESLPQSSAARNGVSDR